MTVPSRQALCCVCGALRTCHHPRNHRRENYFLRGPVDRNWHRELGDLKCANCGEVTTHAILHREGDNFRDHAERVTRIALGGDDTMGSDTIEEIRGKYRQGRQANPYLNHMWSGRDEDAARKAGKTTVMSHCGEVMKIPEKSSSITGGGQLRPDPVRWNQEYEDPDTGNWWVELDCPDCLRVVNDRRLAANRKRLKLWLVWLLRDPARVPDEHVETLIAALESATQGGGSE